MTVTANTTRNDYVGNGQSVYSYTFQLNDASDVTVYLDGVVQTLNTHYTVENVGVGTGGTITFTLVDENNNPIHPTSSETISIVMEMDLDRDTNYQQSGLFAASDVNNDFDRLWLATNQQQTRLGRSIHIANNDLDRDMFLPLYNQRANKILAFDSNGNVTTSTADYADWDSSYNNMITSASFSGGNYTLTQQDGGTISTSLDGRYHKIGTDIPNADISQSSVTQHQGALSITESQISDLGSYLPLSGGTMSGDVEFGANKAKFVGLEIYNTIGNTSVIEETGAGNLNIKGQDVRIQTPTNEDIIKGEADGAVTLYYDNNAKLATTNTGISVTGTLSATGYNDSNWNDAYNNKITAVNYSGSTLTLTQQDGGTLTTTINGALGTSLVYNGATKAEAVATGLDVTGGMTTTGNVGIGTTSPAYTLDIESASPIIKLEDTDTNTQMLLNASSGVGGFNFEFDSTSVASAPYAAFKMSGSEAMRIDSSGKVGIGTTNPTAKLDVLAGADQRLLFTTLGTDPFIGAVNGANSAYKSLQLNGSDMKLMTSGSERMRIDSSGNLGIGTSSPDSKLHVQSGGEAIRVNTTNENTHMSFGGTRAKFGYARIGVSDLACIQGSTGKGIVFCTDNDTFGSGEKARIDASGRVGIGTTSPNYELTVAGGSNNSIQIVSSTTGTGATNGLRFWNTGSSTAMWNYDNTPTLFGTNNNEAMRIDSSGNLLVGKTSDSINTAGVQLNADGLLVATRDGGNTAVFNRKTDDGKLVQFRKDNTIVGSIGTAFSVPYLANGSNFGIRVDDAGSGELLPTDTTGSGLDASADLGRSNIRFKDLYLSGNVHTGDGTAASPAYTFGDDTNTGIFSPAADTIAFSEGGTEAMRIDSSGNVGIGTTSPDARLHVVGNVPMSSHVATFESATFQTSVYIKDTSTTANQNLGFRSFGDDLSIVTNGSPNFTFTESGRLGIGTIFPTDDLDIENSDGAVIRLGRGTVSNVANDRLGAINFYNEDSSDEGPNNAVVIEGRTEDMFGSSGVLILKTNASATEGVEAGETMRLNSAGNVGIGTTLPATKLDVNGSLRASGLRYPTSDGTANQVMVTDGSGNLSFASRSLWSSGGLSYIGSSTVLVSQYTPSISTTTAKLNVFKGNGGTSPDSDSTVFFDSSGHNVLQLGSGTYYTSAINFGNSFNNSRGRIEVNQGSAHMAFKNNYSERMRINSSGHLSIGTTSAACDLTVHGGGSYVSAPIGTLIQGRDTNNNAYLQLTGHYMGAAGVYFGDSGDSDRAGVIYSNYSDRLDFNANASTRMSINSSGNVGIGTTSPQAPLDINGNRLIIRDSKTPSSATATGIKGEICYDSNYMYVCVATNTWKRAALASW